LLCQQFFPCWPGDPPLPAPDEEYPRIRIVWAGLGSGIEERVPTSLTTEEGIAVYIGIGTVVLIIIIVVVVLALRR
jgi:hypothetical protein